jgi:hypothetical protein
MWDHAQSLSTIQAARARSRLAAHDLLCLGYHGYMLARVALAPRGEAWAAAMAWTASLLLVSATAIFSARSAAPMSQRARRSLYRAGLFVPMVLSYLSLRTVLPALAPVLRDNALLRADRRLLGETPALAWQGLAGNRAIVEWLSFHYFSYFIVLALNLFPALLARRESPARAGSAAQQLLVGALVVSALGHVGYTLVPALGPYASTSFDTPLLGATWWSIVQSTVSSAGAQLDVFPSLHTAFPCYFALHAIARRRPTWPLELFVALNIVVSTMFLRWHYAVDVIAGLCLAALARAFASASAAAARERPDVWL